MRLTKQVMGIVLTAAMVTVFSFCALNVGIGEAYAEDETSEVLKATSVSCGFDSFAAVDEDGAAWVMSSSPTTAGEGGQYGSNGCNPSRIIPGNIISVKSSINGYVPNDSTGYKDGQNAALCSDGSLWIWGTNRYGTLGNGENGYGKRSNCPVKITGLSDIVDYDISGLNSAAVTADGKLYVWGDNSSYQIGDGTDIIRTRPVMVMGDVKSAAVGYSSNGQNACTAAIKNDDTLWMWGFNYNGVLGIENEVNGNYVTAPNYVMDNVADISIGDGFAVAVKNDGTLWTWGTNDTGALGTGGTTSTAEPTQIMTNVKTAAAGLNHVLALKNNGSLYSWGRNDYGQLGNGKTTASYMPSKIMEDVEAIDAGYNNSIALKTDGTIWRWGITKFSYSAYYEYSESTYDTKRVQLDLTTRTVNYEAEGQNRDIDISWNDKWLEDTSSVYNHDLAIAGVVLSTAAENNYAENTLNRLGFNTYANDSLEYNYGSNDIDKPACSVGYKVITDTNGNKKMDIVLVCRGTTTMEDIVTDVKAKNDGFLAAGEECHDNLNKALNKIAEATGMGITYSNTRLFITGHSLGGACANIVTMLIADKETFDPDNIYMYTYASPKINVTWTDFRTRYSIPGAFNIVNNCGDIVHYFWNFSYKVQTGPLGSKFVFPITNSRMGQDIAYNNLYGNEKFLTYAKILYGDAYESSLSMMRMLKAHFSTTYLAALMSDEPVEFAYKTFRLVSAHCPVDVAVFDEKGNACGYTKDDVAYNDDSSPVRIVAIDDEKFIELPDSGVYRVEYTGTDEGTMEITDQIYDAGTGEIIEEKEFSNVAVAAGKTFESMIDTGSTAENTKVYVTDNNDIIAEVQKDGSEVKVKTTAPINNAAVTGITNKTYTGKAITQNISVKLNNAELKSGTDYTVAYKNNINVGTATVTITGTGGYTGAISKSFQITKAANTLTVKGKTVTVKFAKVKKKAQTLKVSKVIKFTNKGQGTKTYVKAKGSKKITINKKTGKVIVKKGLKKGTYKVKVKVKAGGDNNYTALTKTVTFKIKVK